LDPGIIGGFLLPVLGSLPDCFMIIMSGAFAAPDVAKVQLDVGGTFTSNLSVILMLLSWYFGWFNCFLVDNSMVR